MSECHREVSIMTRPWSSKGSCAMKKKKLISHCNYYDLVLNTAIMKCGKFLVKAASLNNQIFLFCTNLTIHKDVVCLF